MSPKYVPLEEILKKEYIFVDSNLIGNEHELAYIISNEVNNFSEINQNLRRCIKTEIESIKNSEEFILNNNIHLFPAVFKEIEAYKNCINKRLRYLRKFKPIKESYSGNKRDIIEKSESLLESLNLELEDFLKNCSCQIWDIETESCYPTLFDLVKSLENIIPKKYSDYQNYPDTDSQLITGLFTLSLKNQSSSLLTADKRFEEVLPVISRIICAEDFMPENEKFRKSFFEHPFKLYLKNNSKNFFHSSFISNDGIFFKGYENKELKDRVYNFFKDLKTVNEHPSVIIPYKDSVSFIIPNA
ncbi:MAG: hypothetical protein ACOYT4_00285 [Nanoarchaeota archaeon]